MLTEDNLRIAQRRQTLGVTGPAEVYRWEIERANGRNGVVAAGRLVDVTLRNGVNPVAPVHAAIEAVDHVHDAVGANLGSVVGEVGLGVVGVGGLGGRVACRLLVHDATSRSASVGSSGYSISKVTWIG